MGNSIRCRRRVPINSFETNIANQQASNIIPTENSISANDDQSEWLLIPQAHNVAANDDQTNINVISQHFVMDTRRIALFRFRKAVRRVQSILRIRYLWARIGNMLTASRSLRTHTSRRHDILNSVWQALRPLTWRYAEMFRHLKRTGGRLHYNIP